MWDSAIYNADSFEELIQLYAGTYKNLKKEDVAPIIYRHDGGCGDVKFNERQVDDFVELVNRLIQNEPDAEMAAFCERCPDAEECKF